MDTFIYIFVIILSMTVIVRCSLINQCEGMRWARVVIQYPKPVVRTQSFQRFTRATSDDPTTARRTLWIKSGEIEDLQERIHIDPCGYKDKCNLPKARNVTVTFRIFTSHEVNSLTNNVEADIFGMRLPFFGVHGTEACGSIYHADDVTPAPCPLEANKEYIYRHVFLVQPMFPELTTRVTWSLDDGDKKVICFIVPISIVKKKN